MIFAYIDIVFISLPVLIVIVLCCGWCFCIYICWNRFCYCCFTRRKVFGRKTALITGGSSGIGFSLAKLLIEDQYNVILVARNLEKLENAKKTLEEITAQGYEDSDITVRTMSCDFSNPQNIRQLVATLEQESVNIDVLINNAGFGSILDFSSQPEEGLLNMINVNITSLTLLTRLLLPKFIENGEGKILNVASIAGFRPVPRFCVYAATKAYVRSFSHALNFELREHNNITVTCLSPGSTKTDFDAVAFREGAYRMKSDERKEEGQSSDECAYEGYRSMMLGEDEVVSGFGNWFNMKIVVPLLHTKAFMMIADSRYQRNEINNNRRRIN